MSFYNTPVAGDKDRFRKNPGPEFLDDACCLSNRKGEMVLLLELLDILPLASVKGAQENDTFILVGRIRLLKRRSPINAGPSEMGPDIDDHG